MRDHLRVTLAALPLLACDGGTHLSGVVRDRAGRPVADAVVVLRWEDGAKPLTAVTAIADSAVSDSAGKFDVGFMHPTGGVPLSLRVTRPGFAPYHVRFRSDGPRPASYVVTLLPLPRPVPHSPDPYFQREGT